MARTMSDEDIDALADALSKRALAKPATVSEDGHCLLQVLFPNTQEGHKRLLVFKDVLDALMKMRNAIGTIIIILIGIGVLIVCGVVVYAVTLGHINPFKFLGLG